MYLGKPPPPPDPTRLFLRSRKPGMPLYLSHSFEATKVPSVPVTMSMWMNPRPPELAMMRQTDRQTDAPSPAAEPVLVCFTSDNGNDNDDDNWTAEGKAREQEDAGEGLPGGLAGPFGGGLRRVDPQQREKFLPPLRKVCVYVYVCVCVLCVTAVKVVCFVCLLVRTSCLFVLRGVWWAVRSTEAP